MKAGLKVDEFVPRFSFFWGIGMNFFMEIAKMRAARVLWARIVKKYNPENLKSMALRTHCQTSGYSLTAQDPYNNVARTCIEGLAAAFGGTQSLHTNSLDEAIALPTDYSAGIARDTQKYMQSDLGITQAIDPWSGSYYVESLTNDLIEKAWQHILEVEELGGMTKAIESGLPKSRIEAAAARKQAQIDSLAQQVIGVNIFKPESLTQLDTLEVNNTKVRNSQGARLEKIKTTRDQAKVGAALAKVTAAAKDSNSNILAAAIGAARCRATLGEISDAIEAEYGRFKATTKSISGVYAKEIKMDEKFSNARMLSEEFTKMEGRRPRIMVAKLGQDGHDRGAKIIATSFADLGFDVDIGPLFQTPGEAARQAAENDVHILGISSLAAGHKTLVPETIQELAKIGKEDIMVIVGGVIPPQDYQLLFDAGAAAVFGPGTIIAEAAAEILYILINELKEA
jgi:methylmalonyl-CoA mutase